MHVIMLNVSLNGVSVKEKKSVVTKIKCSKSKMEKKMEMKKEKKEKTLNIHSIQNHNGPNRPSYQYDRNHWMISAFLHLVNVFLSNTSLGNLPIFDGPFPSFNAKYKLERKLFIVWLLLLLVASCYHWCFNALIFRGQMFSLFVCSFNLRTVNTKQMLFFLFIRYAPLIIILQ